MSYYIGIDVGTSSVKASIINPTDARILTYRALYSELGNTPAGWWEALKRAVAQVTADLGPDCGGLGMDAQVGTYILYHENEPADSWPVYGWGGPYGSAQREALQKEKGTEYFVRHTGMPLPMVNSFPIARMRWFAEERTDEWNHCTHVLAPKDYLYLQLTGELISDSFTWNGLENPATGVPDDEILDLVGISRRKLPRMVPALAGPAGLSEASAAALGLRPGTPVYMGCNDAHASILGMGVTSLSQAFDLTGTSEHIGLITPNALGDGELVCSPYFEGFTTFGVTASSGQSIDWGMERFPADEEALWQVYRSVAAGEKAPPLFLPYVCGERSPIWDGDARGAFLGLSNTHTDADMLYSVFEGVVFSVWHIWSMLPESLTGDVRRLRLGGGASQNDFLNALKADLFGTSLEILAEKNTGALGAGMIAAVGNGAWKTLADAADACVRLHHTVNPQADPRFAQALRRRFEVYRDVCGINRAYDLYRLR